MYEPLQHSDVVTPRLDIEIHEDVNVLPDEGIFVTRSGKIADGSHSAAFPVWTSGDRTDVQELRQVTTIFGDHLGQTDKYVADGVSYAEGDELTISSDSSTLGYLEPAGSGDPVVAVVTTAPADNDGLLEIHVK